MFVQSLLFLPEGNDYLSDMIYSYHKRCDGTNATRQSLMSIKSSYSEPFIDRVDIKTNYYGFTSSDFSDIRLRINPVVCYAGTFYFISLVCISETGILNMSHPFPQP